MTIQELKTLLARFHIKPSHKLGQNFLLSEKALDEIVNAAELDSRDTVLEIGPGLGVLTRRLGERAGLVLAVEKDYKLVNALRKLFKSKKNIKITQGDALFIDPLRITNNYESTNPDSYISKDSYFVGNSYKLIANIPYYITGKLLQNFLSKGTPPTPSLAKEGELPLFVKERAGESSRPSLMVLLLQKEVAERITARPGQMSILSVSVQFYAQPEIVSQVSRTEFYPAPEVDSAVVKITPFPYPPHGWEGIDEKKFFRLVKIGFAGKRKQLHNNLASGLGAERDYKKILESLGLNPLARAQDLSMEHWQKLYKILS